MDVWNDSIVKIAEKSDRNHIEKTDVIEQTSANKEMKPEVECKADYQLSPHEKKELHILLKSSFPGYFEDRLYHKQIPKFRLLAKIKGRIMAK